MTSCAPSDHGNFQSPAFVRVAGDGFDKIEVFVDGTPVTVTSSDTAASAILLSGDRALRRSATTGERRAPFCMMGACFECLVTVDSQDNVQACLVPVHPGMRIDRNLEPSE